MCKVSRRCWRPGKPRPAGFPRRAEPQHPSRGAVAGRCSADTSRRPGRHGWRRGPPYLDDGRAGGSGGGGVRLRLRAPRRRPSPRAQRRRLLPSSPAGGAGGRGRSPAHAPPARPAGATPPSAPSWPPGAGLGARTRAQYRCAPWRTHAAVIGADRWATKWRLRTVRAACLHVPPLPRVVSWDQGLDLLVASVSPLVKWKQ